MMSEQSTEGFNLDGILSELGSFGKYQLLLLMLLAFRDSFLMMCNFNYVFTAADVPFRCIQPSLDNTTVSWIDFPTRDGATCYHGNGSAGDTSRVFCENIVYENYNSVVAEFNLGCQPWKATLIGTVHNLGLVFSFILSGFISDRYGRKVIIVATPLVVGVAGLLKSFAADYWTLLALEFLETALGYGNASMVLSLEAVSHSQRVVFACLSDTLASAGGAGFGLLAWRVPYWRHLMRAIYAPLLVVVVYIFAVDEGVRWLVARGRRAEAARVLRKVAKVNRVTLSPRARDTLARIAAGDAPAQDTEEQSGVLAALRSRALCARAALLAASFVCCSFVFSGAILNSVTISSTKYLNFSIMMLVQVPTRLVTALTLTRFGRKLPICVAYCFCAVFFMASAFVPKSFWWATLVLYMAGKMCSSYGIYSMHVLALELFPTRARNSLTNLANTVGRLGSVLAPQTPLLEGYFPGLPSILFSLAALGPAILALALPDTAKAALPDKLADAENIDGKDADKEMVAKETVKERL
ncbi:organic cation transporter protein-like isoform X2 [Colias croceus]|uniref:organic cation transporter protein-like isoform X1 n=1 Tax=Colias crocea TaxID=72248 RepID=UPI001E27F3E8|nr:organic cation transporter protein-like isoform X1 [Colias croceus]XP_045498947.1 organic cation transporter protein-like isoform X2 [Colias croceus]